MTRAEDALRQPTKVFSTLSTNRLLQTARKGERKEYANGETSYFTPEVSEEEITGCASTAEVRQKSNVRKGSPIYA